MTTTQFTRPQADLIIRHHLGEYLETRVTDDAAEFSQFRRRLAYLIEADLPDHHLREALEDFENIDLALEGMLDETVCNRDGTIDNRLETADYYADELTKDINQMLDWASIDGAWVTR